MLMTELLPVFSADTTVVHIPSAAERKRQRGYDHAEYIARKLARNSNLNFQKILGRHGNARQVGATREVRLKQLQGAFYVKNSNINDKHILLVDDIVTTGGTLEAAAKVLRQAGAKQIDAVVFAQK
jgi:ComF family protein